MFQKNREGVYVKHKTLFTPIKIGSMEIRNRLVVPPQGSNFADKDGKVTPLMIDYYEDRAKGGFGLVIIEITCVDPGGKAIIRQPALWSDDYIEGFKNLADAIHKHGAKIAVQIHHAGRQTFPALIEGKQPVSCSPVPCPTCQVVPHELSTSEVYELIDKFIETAKRCQKAGVDAVELHGAHGYMVAQFISSYSNHRIDEFGGSLHNRMRFPRLIVEGIRRELGNGYPIIFRISGDEKVPGGRGIVETTAICRVMEEAGVDCMHVSCGSYGSMEWIIPPSDAELGLFTDLAAEVKKAIKVPVIAVGRVNDPYIAESVIALDRADMVSVGRQSIADAHFPNKILSGKIDEVSPCIACETCISEVFQGFGSTCAVNPFGGRGITLSKEPIEPTTKDAKKVVVVGAGPGGLVAAMTAAYRGHTVTLFEKEKDVGGQFIIASYPTGKGDLAKSISYYKHMCQKLGVKIQLNTEATEDLIMAENPDAIILATGGVPLIPAIKGIDDPNLVKANDVLTGKAAVGQKVLVAGGGMVGAETADFLGHYNKEVTVIEMSGAIAGNVQAIIRATLMKRLGENRTAMLTSATIKEFFADGVTVEIEGQDVSMRGFDTVVLALGAKSYNPLEDKIKDKIKDKFKDKVKDVYVIGDAKNTGLMFRATESAAAAAVKI